MGVGLHDCSSAVAQLNIGHELMPIKLVAALVIAASGFAVSACSSSVATGTVIGVATPCAGPSGNPSPNARMTVLVTDSHDKVVVSTRSLVKPWRFRFELAAGTYSFHGTGDPTVTAHVPSGGTVHVKLFPNCG